MDSYSLGTWLGGILTGVLSDRAGTRAIIMCPMLVLSAIILFCINYSLSSEPAPYFFAIFFAGMFLGGPYNLVSSVCTTDLAKQESLRGRPKVLAFVSSVIEATASFGSALFQIVISVNQEVTFYLFTLNTLVTLVLLLPIGLKDYRSLEKEPQKSPAADLEVSGINELEMRMRQQTEN